VLDKLVGITTQAVVALLRTLDVITPLSEHWYLFENFDLDIYWVEWKPLFFQIGTLCEIHLFWFAKSLTYLGV